MQLVGQKRQNKMLSLSCEDNMDLMGRYPDGYFDLAIVDPPYGIGESRKTQSRPLFAKQKNGSLLRVTGARKHKVKDWDNQRPSAEYFKELFRVSKNQIIWGGNYFADLLPAKSGWVVWDKLNEGTDQSDCELAWTSFNCGLRKVSFLWNGFIQGRPDDPTRAQGNKKLNQKRIHPTEKPFYIYRWLLKKYAKPGEKILDTHLGSGSIAIACHDYDFSLTACEIDPEYFSDAMERITQYTNQLRTKIGDQVA